MKYRCIVVIVVYSQTPLLANLLSQIHDQSQEIAYETKVMLIYTGTSRDWVDDAVLSSRAKDMTIVYDEKKNIGFAKACNKGIRISKIKDDDVIIFLNPDIKLQAGCLQSMVSSNTDIGGAVISFNRNGNVVYDTGGYVSSWIGRPWHRENIASLPGYIEDPTYVSGCAMMIRGYVIKKIGGFDERYFLYFEDVDFCLRAKMYGYSVKISQKALVEHSLLESSERTWAKSSSLLISNLFFIMQHIFWWRKPIALGYWFLLVIYTLCRYGIDI